MDAISAVIVDDHDVVAAGVRAWCEAADPPINLLNAGARLINVWTGPGATADVVILDLGLKTAGPELGELRRLVEAGRRVVVYTQEAANRTAIQCIDHGALAYVTKLEGGEHLIPAIHAAARGNPYTPPSLSGALAVDGGPDRPQLTEREQSVLRAWFACSSKRLAAERLGLRPKTIDTYIERVRVRYAAVGRPAPSKSALVARALEDGLISLAELGPQQTGSTTFKR